MTLAPQYAAAVNDGLLPPASALPSEDVMTLELVRLVEREPYRPTLATEFGLRLSPQGGNHA